MRSGFLLEQAFAPVPGGTGRYSVDLFAALDRARPQGSTLTAVAATHRGADRRAAAGDAPLRTLPVPRRALAEAWRRGLPPRVGGFDVVHAPTLLVPPVPRRTRLVVTVHDAVPWTHPETLGARGTAWHRDMAARAERADAVVVPTAAVAAQLAEHLSGLDAARVHVLGEGVPAAFRTPAAPPPPGLPAGYLVTVATAEPRKGLDVLVDALALLGTAPPPLVCIGPRGWGGVDVTELARRAGLPADRVTWF